MIPQRLFDRCLWVLLALMIGIYILLALFISAGRFYMPQLESISPRLVSQLEQQTGLDWKIEGLSGEWHRLKPVFRVRTMRAQRVINNDSNVNDRAAAAHNTVLALTNAELQIDVVASLLAREPRIVRAQLQSLSVSLDKSANGWHLRGLVAQPSTYSLSLPGFIRRLQSIDAGQVLIDLPAGANTDSATARTVLPAMGMHYQRYGSAGRFRFQQSDANGNGIKILANTQGDIFTRDASVDIYVRAQEFSLSPWFVAASTEMVNPANNANKAQTANKAKTDTQAKTATQPKTVNDWLIDDWTGELWLRRAAQQDLQLSLKLNDGAIQRADSPQWRLSDVSVDLGAKSNEQGGIDIWWQHLSGQWRDEPLTMPLASVSIARHDQQVTNMLLAAPLVDIGQLTEIVRGSGLLSGRVPEIIGVLQPEGLVKQLQISIPNGKRMADFSLQAELDNVSFAAWKTIPGATGVAGYIDASATRGELKLDAQQAFTVSFPRLYHHSLDFSQANASIQWQFIDKRIVVDGRDITLTAANGPGRYGLDFTINARTNSEQEPSQMQLSIGVQDSAAGELLQFLPYTVDPGLQQWAAQSDITGYVHDGAFIYNGSMQKGETDKRSIALYFNLADTALNFHPDWSRVTKVEGLLDITGKASRMAVYNGDFSGLSIADSQVAVHTSGDNRRVEFNGQIAGTLSDALNVLQTSPLKRQLGGIIGQWQAGGDLRDARMVLTVPMVDIVDNPPVVDFSASLANSTLDMQNLGLVITALNGPLAYSSANGLVSPKLSGQLWGETIEFELGNFDKDSENRSGGNFRINGRALVDTEHLYRWLRQPVLALADGKANIDFTVNHIRSKTTVSARSDLRGVSLALPDRFYKMPELPVAMQLDWQISEANQPMQLNIADRADIWLQFNDFKLHSGVVDLGFEANATQFAANFVNTAGNQQPGAAQASPVLAVSGHMQRFNLSEWLPVFNQYLQADVALDTSANRREARESGAKVNADTDTQVDSQTDTQTQLVVDDLRLDNLIVFDEMFSNSVVDVAFAQRRWRFSIESDQMQGMVALPESDGSGQLSIASDQTELSDVQALEQPPGSLMAMPLVDSDLPIERRYLLDLNYLRLDQRELLTDTNAGFDHTLFLPSSLIAAKVNIQQLYWGDQPLGQWQFLLSPTDNAVLIHEISGSYSSLKLRSDSDDGLLWASRPSGDFATSLNINVESDAIETFIASLDNSEQPSSPIKGKSTTIAMDLNWQGGPDAFSLNTIDGDINFNVRDGQFLRASSSAQGLLKLVGVINFDTLLRRMQLNFSDLLNEGLSFDELNGAFNMANGIASFTETPIVVKAPSSAFSLSGQVDLEAATIDAELIATLPVASNLPWVAALAGGLPVAAGVFIASKVFENELDRLSSAVYIIKGPLADPETRFDRLFDNKSLDSSAATGSSTSPGVGETAQDKNSPDDG